MYRMNTLIEEMNERNNCVKGKGKERGNVTVLNVYVSER